MRIDGSVYPTARRRQLVSRELPDELLIYDLSRNEAYCLNRFSMEVWRRCNGENTIEDIVQSLEQTFGPIHEDLVWLAIKQLDRHKLLEPHADPPPAVARMTRRDAVRRIGIGATLAIPLVSSIVAPVATQAATCLVACHPCSTNSECCSGICMSNPPGCQQGTTRCA